MFNYIFLHFCHKQRLGTKLAYANNTTMRRPSRDYLLAMQPALCGNVAMKKKHQPKLFFGEVRKTINMPPALWLQIEARMNAYEPVLDFADWARRVFQDELRRPARVLPDWLAQPKELP